MKGIEEKKAIKGFKNLARYFSYFKRYKLLCIMFWVSLIGTGLVGFFSPLMLGKIISNMTTEQNFELAKIYAFTECLIEFAGIIIYLTRVPLFKKLENYVKRDVKMQVINDSFGINIGEFEKLGNGAFITRLTGDLDSLATSFISLSETVVEMMSKIGFIIFVYIMNVWIGLFLTAFVVIRYFIYQIRIHYFALLKPQVLRQSENINSMIGESIRGIKDIKVLGLGKNVVRRLTNMQQDFMRKDNHEWYVGASLCEVANTVTVICNLLFIILCVFLIGKHSLDLAIFYSIYVYKNNVMDFAVRIGNLQDHFKEIEVNAHRVFQLVDGVQYERDSFGNVSLPNYNGNIEFKNVSFSYKTHEGVLDNVSFNILPKTHVAFVGESGCGKSTIVSLICKLYEPQSGTVLFDGIESTNLNEEFFNNIAMVNQSPYLFNLTIRENMQLVREEVTDAEIFKALKLANAYEFVKALPQGLDSFLGEGGTRLSGGQKQRICIARALLKDSKVLIFDEATSALDNISQEYVMDSIESLKKHKTIITIAHRLSTIEDCDVIFYIDHGKIIDSGTHEYLVKHNKKYAALYNKQKKEALINEK